MPSHPGVLANLLDALAGRTVFSEEAGLWFMLDPGLALLLHRRLGSDTPTDGWRQQIPVKELKDLAAGTAQRLLDRPETALTDAAWTEALALAHLCRALADRHAVQDRQCAWLAGLLCTFEDCDHPMEDLGLCPYSGDVASLAIEARRLLATQNRNRRGEIFLTELPVAAAEELLLEEVDKAVEAWTMLAHTQTDLAAALQRFGRAEADLAGPAAPRRKRADRATQPVRAVNCSRLAP